MKRLLLVSLLAGLLGETVVRAVTFTVSPSAVGNAYAGFVTLQINGLTNGESALVQKYVDANANGVVDAGDFLVQQFTVTDGHATIIGGVTNINVPFDSTPTDGAITCSLALATEGVAQQFVAPYLVVLSSPVGRWAAITNHFAVTNSALGQTVSGLAQCNGTNVPYAGVLLSEAASGKGGFKPVAGAIASASGAFTIAAPPASYQVFAFTPSLLANLAFSPFTLAAGASVNTNVSLVPGTATISGQFVDASNTAVGLPGILMAAINNNSGVAGFGVSGSTGGFAVPALLNTSWQIGTEQQSLDALGYLSTKNNSNINVASGNVSGVVVDLVKGTSGFYGSVDNPQSQPLAGVRLYGQGNSASSLQADATTDANGHYFMALAPGTWDVEVDTGNLPPGYANYLFSQSAFSGNNGGSGTNVAGATAVNQNFVGFAAANTISGSLQDNGGNPISGVGVSATATLNGTQFNTPNSDTDSSGHYSIPVGNGSWSVSLNCCSDCGSSDSLPGNYQCPGNQTVDINNNNGTANFVVQGFSSYLSGRVVTQSGNPVTNISVFAVLTNGGSFGPGNTDANGDFQFGIAAGSYLLQLNTGGQDGTPGLGLVSPSIPITVNNGASLSNLVLVALQQTGAINALVTNSTSHTPVPSIYVSANATINGTNYFTGTQPTAANGSVALVVANGSWNVSVDCGGLNSLGDSCPGDQFVTVNNNTVPAIFSVTSNNSGGGAPSALSAPSWQPGQFQFLVGAPSGQNYAVQYSTNLSGANWTPLYATNNLQGSNFLVTDPNATNQQRFYRVIGNP